MEFGGLESTVYCGLCLFNEARRGVNNRPTIFVCVEMKGVAEKIGSIKGKGCHQKKKNK